MKKFWKSSNKILYGVLLSTLLLAEISFSETPKDIWEQSKSIKKVETNNNLETQNKQELPPTTILQIPKTELEISNISQTEIEQSNRQAIFGIYDPGATNIPVTFWDNMSPEIFDSFRQTMAQGDNRRSVNQLIARVFFSKTNLSNHEDKGVAYLNFVSSFLAHSQDTKLIDSVIDQNNLLLNNEQLLGFLINNNFSNYQIEKACKYAQNLGAEIKNFELQKFKILCLVQAKESKKALANLELIRENGFKDDFFIQKVNFLLGMLLARQGESKTDTLLNIHLSSLVNPMFNPNFSVFKGDLNKTKYFFNSPFVEKILLENQDSKKEFVTEDDFALVEFLEQGSNIELFKTENIFAIYKKIIFGIEDLLNPNETYIKYHPVKGRALLYQAILLTKDQQQKLTFIEALQNSYKKSKFLNLGNKVYYQLISDIDQKYLTKEIQEQMVQYFESLKKKKSDLETNDKFLHTSDAVFLLTDEKPESKSKKSLETFADLVDDKKYEVTKRDVAMINLLAQQKVYLPSSLRKFVNPDEIYIPNKIYNMLEKNENNKATLEVLQLVKSLNSSKEYARDFLVITKILDRLGFGLIKQDFIKYELIAS
jgi:hypothetical protein